MSQTTACECFIYHYIQVMKEWLESIVDALQKEETMRKLASALCVTHCLPKLGIYNVKIEKFVLPLVRMLYLKPDLEKKVCPDYVHLCEILPQKHRYVIYITDSFNICF